MRVTLRRTAALIFRPLPQVVRRRLVQLVLTASGSQRPRDALVALFAIEDDVAAAVNDAAMRLDAGVHPKHRLTGYHDYFVERIADSRSVLDVGCGYGAVAYSIAARTDASVVGIDLDRDNIAMARRRFAHPRLEFVQGDALEALPDRTFEILVLSNVLEHIEDRIGFLRALVARVRPRSLLIRVPMFDRDWRVPLRRELGIVYVSDPSHFTEYTSGSFASEMAAAALDIADLRVNWGEIWAEVRPRRDAR